MNRWALMIVAFALSGSLTPPQEHAAPPRQINKPPAHVPPPVHSPTHTPPPTYHFPRETGISKPGYGRPKITSITDAKETATTPHGVKEISTVKHFNIPIQEKKVLLTVCAKTLLEKVKKQGVSSLDPDSVRMVAEHREILDPGLKMLFVKVEAKFEKDRFNHGVESVKAGQPEEARAALKLIGPDRYLSWHERTAYQALTADLKSQQTLRELKTSFDRGATAMLNVAKVGAPVAIVASVKTLAAVEGIIAAAPQANLSTHLQSIRTVDPGHTAAIEAKASATTALAGDCPLAKSYLPPNISRAEKAVIQRDIKRAIQGGADPRESPLPVGVQPLVPEAMQAARPVFKDIPVKLMPALQQDRLIATKSTLQRDVRSYLDTQLAQTDARLQKTAKAYLENFPTAVPVSASRLGRLITTVATFWPEPEHPRQALRAALEASLLLATRDPSLQSWPHITRLTRTTYKSLRGNSFEVTDALVADELFNLVIEYVQECSFEESDGRKTVTPSRRDHLITAAVVLARAYAECSNPEVVRHELSELIPERLRPANRYHALYEAIQKLIIVAE